MAILDGRHRSLRRPRIGAQGGRCILLWLLLLLFLVDPAAGEEAPPLEDAIKATFVGKFAPFVTWPQENAGDQGPFLVCSFGDDRVTKVLGKATDGQRVGGRPVALRTVRSPQDLAGCNVLYVAQPQAAEDIWNAVKAKPILTITQSPGFGMIQFVTVEHHVRFDVDLALARESNLSISSKLLGLARSVSGEQKEHG